MITTTKNLNEHVAKIDSALIFKEDWMRSVCNQLDNNTESFKKLISDMFDKDFDDASLTLYNSVYNNSYKTKATDYFLKVREKNIINENGVLTFKHSVRTSVIEKCIDGGILGRQIKKKEKQRLIKEKQYMLADNAGIFEYILKVLINGCYGLHLYPGSPFYNVTLAATCTAAARNMVAVASIVIELIEGGWRNYQVQAHLKMIEVCKTMSKEINSKYQLLDCTVEEVLKVMLGDYYETYYAKTALRHALEKVDYDTLKLLYIKNNVYAFMKLPRVDGILKELLRIQKENPTEYIVNPKRDPLYKDLMQELYDMSADILYGFYYYDGDYDNGVYHNTLVDIIENIKRKKIVLMDTDSSVTSFMREVNYVLDTYHGQYDETDDKVVDGSIPSVVSWIYMGCIAKSLFDYVMELGVSPEYAKKVEMEAEHIMEQIQLNLAKKSYAFLPIITDFFMNAKLKLKLKGVSLIKSNFNAEFSAMGKSLLEEKVMVPLEQLNYRDIIMTTKLNTKKAIDILRSDDFILNKRTLLKINSSTLSYSEHKMKSVTLWNMLYPN
ncbi:MAG: family B DNA polymerase, partial [Peptostreptococcaceae bacterium]